jgi:hypothetical protein
MGRTCSCGRSHAREGGCPGRWETDQASSLPEVDGEANATVRGFLRCSCVGRTELTHAVAVWLRGHSKAARGGGGRTFRCAGNIASDLAEALLERGSAAGVGATKLA